ncbi:MAG: extracellular solute-binding protein [Roseburia sp.]|nr:extracellular solute-binding protein [Roseburia sp.]MCM1278187.1 extracellular solute-binding protein [Robinsoniella sp.]
MKKKVLALLLTTSMVATLVGCGSKDEPATEPAESTEDTEEESTDTEAEAEPEESEEEGADTEVADEPWSGTLKVWSPQEDQDTGWLSAQCDAFNAAHPDWDITFEYGVCPEGDAKTNVTQDVENAADVYMLANDNISALVASNALAELGGDYLNYVNETNGPSISASVTYNDAVYAFPFTSNTWFMYYDKSVYSEEDAKSFDTMLEKGKVSFPLTNSWYIQAFYAANGCTLFGDGTDEAAGIDFGGDKAAAVTNYLVDLVSNPNFVNDADGAGLAGLRDGSVNAVFTGTWDAESVKEALGDNMGVAALPTVNIDGNVGTMKSFMGSKAIGVNPNAENQQVAMALAAYLASEEAQQAHYDMRGILPTNTNITVEGDDVAAAVAEVANSTSIMQPFVSKMDLYWSPAENMGKAILAGEVTHDNAAEKTEDMNTTMNTDLAE